MDMIALAAANALIGNPAGTAAIEFTLIGDRYRVEAESVRVAVAGDVALTIDDAPAAAWRSHRLRRGQRLAIGALRRGARGYLAIAGGLATSPQLASRSVHARSGLGGAALRDGDHLALPQDHAEDRTEQALDPKTLPYLDGAIRVVLGPQDAMFTEAGITTFLSSVYRITAEADRMGYRLDGPEIEHLRGFNTISDAIMTGSIQVPGTRKPIVLMSDRQTTGGYPKIATTATASLPTLAQLRPGDLLRFESVTVTEARTLLAAQRLALARFPTLLRPAFRDPRDLPSEELLAENLITGVVAAN
jgi:biotin-dependent carboxylase-like uncharacterized protein